MLSQHSDEVNLNERLFARVKGVYDCRNSLKLNQEQSRLLEETYKHFVRGGANLTVEKKEQLKKVNQELSLLDLTFGDNLLAETNEYKMVVDKKKILMGCLNLLLPGLPMKQGSETGWEMGFYTSETQLDPFCYLCQKPQFA